MSQSKEGEVRRISKRQLDLAEQQFVGYYHHQKGHRLIMLIEAMGLSEDEWIKMKKRYGLEYMPEEDVREIDTHFENQKK